MDKIIGMFVEELYEDLEFWSVYMRVREAGFKVLIIGTKAQQNYISKSGGLSVKSDVAASSVDSKTLFALLVPGGFAPDKLRRDKDVLRLVKEIHESNKILGFICHAGWVAVSAKIINNGKVTGSLGIKDDLENAGGHWIDEPAFRDGNIVWGRVVDDIPMYQKELIMALTSK